MAKPMLATPQAMGGSGPIRNYGDSSCKGPSRPSRVPCACLTVPNKASVSWAAKAF
ncbi:MAG: hypothetical protein ACREYE_02120 [Gammaproteobacteria bacterium]